MESSDRETLSKVEVLGDLEPVVDKLMEAHVSKRVLWFPSELLAPPDGEDPERHRAALRERARGIHDSARVAVGLNLLTEEGLPHFHRLLAKYLDENGYWSQWNYLWTAEEDRHGAVLHDYARDADLFDPLVIEKMQFAYLRDGFDPVVGQRSVPRVRVHHAAGTCDAGLAREHRQALRDVTSRRSGRS